MPKKGIVLEIDGRKAIVLTRDGDFRRVPLPSFAVSIGEEVALPEEGSWLRGFVFRQRWRLLPVAAALLIVLLFPFLPGWGQNPTYYVSIDINPSLELTLNQRELVIAARALNQDGQRLLERVPYLRQPVIVVLQNLLEQAWEEKYLKPDGAVVIAVTPARDQLKERAALTAHKLQKEGQQVLAQKAVSLPLEALTTSLTLRQQAEALRLSVGRYAVLLEAQNHGLPVRPQDLQRERLSTALSRVGGDVREILRQAQKEKSIEDLAEKFREKNLGSFQSREDEKEQGKTIPPNPGTGSGRRPAILPSGRPDSGARKMPPEQEKGVLAPRNQGEKKEGDRRSEEPLKPSREGTESPGGVHPGSRETVKEKEGTRLGPAEPNAARRSWPPGWSDVIKKLPSSPRLSEEEEEKEEPKGEGR